MAILVKLGEDLSIHTGIECPFNTPTDIQQAIELADERISTYKRWTISHMKVIEFLNDQGM